MGATMPIFVTHATEHRTAAPARMMCVSTVVVLTFTVVLMITLRDWQFAPALLRRAQYSGVQIAGPIPPLNATHRVTVEADRALGRRRAKASTNFHRRRAIGQSG
jgi:hypothetical protein